MTHREQATEHAELAEQMLADYASKMVKVNQKATAYYTAATAHASLALYHQREADRES